VWPLRPCPGHATLTRSDFNADIPVFSCSQCSLQRKLRARIFPKKPQAGYLLAAAAIELLRHVIIFPLGNLNAGKTA